MTAVIAGAFGAHQVRGTPPARRVTDLLCDKRVGVFGQGSGAAVRASQYFEQVPVGILEVRAPSVVSTVDLIASALVGICPIGQPALLDARKYLIEFNLADQEGVVLRPDLLGRGDEVQCQLITHLHEGERAEGKRRREPQDLAQKERRALVIARRYYRVIELGRHV